MDRRHLFPRAQVPVHEYLFEGLVALEHRGPARALQTDLFGADLRDRGDVALVKRLVAGPVDHDIGEKPCVVCVEVGRLRQGERGRPKPTRYLGLPVDVVRDALRVGFVASESEHPPVRQVDRYRYLAHLLERDPGRCLDRGCHLVGQAGVGKACIDIVSPCPDHDARLV